jgi:hypothetical protein
MPSYRSRELVVDAQQWTGSNTEDLKGWLGDSLLGESSEGLEVRTPYGRTTIKPWWMIVKQSEATVMVASEEAFTFLFARDG